MKALVYDSTQGGWTNTKGYWLTDISEPRLDDNDSESVLVKVQYAGFCGSDRGIWSRSAFGTFIEESLKSENKEKRIAGHEFWGEIIDAGFQVQEKFGFKVGDTVSAESHVVCGKCYQCERGEYHVCAGDKILGISTDGCFAEIVKVPAKILRHALSEKIDPRIAAIQEPFGNAVHACSKVDIKDKTVAVFGCGAIGSFAVLVAKGLGAKKIIGVEPSKENQQLAHDLGVDIVVTPGMPDTEKPYRHDQSVVEKIKEATNRIGVDVAIEMAGFNSSVNSAIQSTRRGGNVVLFGLKSGDFVIENFETMIRNGITLHSIIGRELWRSWDLTKQLLENTENGIQEKIKKYILKDFQSVVPFHTFDREQFEKTLALYPKVVFDLNQ